MLGGELMNIELKEKLEKFYDEQVWPHMTLGEFIEDCAKKYRDKIALVDGVVELSYQELNRKACHYANGLLKAGFKKGDRIVLQLPNCHEFVIILFAMFKIGVIPVLSLPAHRKNEIKGILEKSGAKAYIAKDKYLGFSYVDMIREVREELNIDFEVYILGDNQGYKNFYKLNDKDYSSQYIDIDYKEMALLMLSSGTTGSPKMIPMKHCELICSAIAIGSALNYSDATIYLMALSLSHKFVLSYPGIIGVFYHGAKCVISMTPSPDEIIYNIEEHNISTMALVPALASLCMDFLEFEKINISSLKIIQVGGSVLEYNKAFEIEKSFGCIISQLYGMTEGLVMCTRFDDNMDIRLNTQGKPVSIGDSVKIVDEFGEEVNTGDYGELLIRGPYTMYGYYGGMNDVNNFILDKELYFRTGDRARKLSNGNYQIAGRIKEMIIKGGEKIIPSELENLLLKNKKISEVQVVGVPDETLGEKICVYILEKDKKLMFYEIIQTLKETGIAEFKLPDCMKIIYNWPLTATGKIDRKRLIENYEN